MPNELEIDGRKIGHSHPPYIIAEMSANHNGEINNAYRIIDMANKCGADAVKLQTYRPDTITMDIRTPEFMIKGGLWDGQSLYELYEKAYMPWGWHKVLFDYAKKVGITIFSSPFDFTAVDLLEDLNAPAYKIASFEAVDIPLIKYVAETRKPMIISTGMADACEIQEAIDAAMDSGCTELAILHCVSGYPAPVEDYNLKTLVNMQQRFGLVTGLSDHTIDNTTSIVSVGLGASIIEKHVTLDRGAGGPDDSFSLEYDDLKSLCDSARIAWSSLGHVDYGRKSSEIGNAQFRRSLYVSESMAQGDVITQKNIKSIRPGFGLAPKYMLKVIGKRVNRSLEAGQALQSQFIEDFYEEEDTLK